VSYAMEYTFSSRSGGQYVKRPTLAELNTAIRQHEPCSTIFKAIGRRHQNGIFDVIKFSPYSIGPNYAGVIEVN
jgi:hypothetical protein